MNPMLKNLFLIRHGECESIMRPMSAQSLPDESNGLTAVGRLQAERLASSLRAYAEQAIVLASPLLRARQTATILAEQLGLQIEIEARLAERDFGQTTGLLQSEVFELQRLAHAHPEQSFAGSETVAQHYARVGSWLESTLQRSEETIFAVCHGGTLDCAQLCIYGSPVANDARVCTLCDPGHYHHWKLRTEGAQSLLWCLSGVNLPIDG